MTGWSLVSTIKAPEQQILAFAAHHLTLGADHLWLYFDDPETPIPALLADHPKITTTLCDAAFWQRRGKRPEKHQVRQSRNANDAYRRTKSPWLTHVDVDEFIVADRPIADILAEMPTEAVVVQLEPFEAMHDPSLPDDIFTARHFRRPLRMVDAALRPLALGDYQLILPNGMLSHSAGKAFFRTGIDGLSLRIHGATQGGVRVPAYVRHPDMRVLHFHAQDRKAWRAALPFRLTRGAYQFHAALQAFLSGASDAEIDAFYDATQILKPETIAALSAANIVWTGDLHLREKLRTIFGVT